jgi:hypothetical protein
VPEFVVDGWRVERCRGETLRTQSFAAALVLSGDPKIEADDLQAAAGLVLDAGGGRLLSGTLDRAHTL